MKGNIYVFSSLAAMLSGAMAGSLADIDHVVLFMQENRAFAHYFGTMSGIRGFSDPNVQINPNGKSVWYQRVNAALSNDTDNLLPFYLNEAGGDFPEATQCMEAGTNAWSENQAALSHGLNDEWAIKNTPWSWGYFKRQDLPTHFGIAEGWTVGDMYQESVITSTNPNRVSWISGSINAPGSPQSPNEGGMYIDNNESPGCEKSKIGKINCYPLKWETFPEYLEAAGISWQVYQDVDNFDDNPLAWFQQFQKAKRSSALHKQGMSFIGLDKFYEDCKTGNLPAVSYIVGPAELSEHPPYQPKDGAWLQNQVVQALIQSKSYKNSALMISYDETGGWGDPVVPYHSPPNTTGEWIQDPYRGMGMVYTGPGFRLPFYIISPWTRNGGVFTEHSDHISQIKFLEKWLAAKGHNVTTSQIPTWRREHMSDLTKAFDFSKPDYSLPDIPTPTVPHKNKKGSYDGYVTCSAKYSPTRPPVPFGSQKAKEALFSEDGFKPVRGYLTEGRYLTFEMSGYGLSLGKGNKLVTAKATKKHDSKSQRFVIHYEEIGGMEFTISSAMNGDYLASDGTFVTSQSDAEVFTIRDLGNGRGHTLQTSSGQYMAISQAGKIQQTATPSGFYLFSVTYQN